MDRATILALNQINRDFYTQRADEFSATRRRPWRGWLRLLPLIGEKQNLSVLDVGCGNGRFAVFLSEHLASPFSYMGVEFSPTALEHARAKLSDLPTITLKDHDVMTGIDELTGSFSLITLFGFLHHVPGFDTRRSLLIELGRLLEPDGILAFSVWQFGRFERFRKRLVPWDTFIASTGVEINPAQLEPGDHILSWGDAEPAYRYCHFTDSDESARLVSSQSLECFEVFNADGRTNDLNQYFLLKRPG